MARYAWISDPHLSGVLPGSHTLKRLALRRLEGVHADGLFITGDISTGLWIESDLRAIARCFKGPVYFVLGNHDYHGRHIDSVHGDIRRLCGRYPNLRWMTDMGVVHLSESVALIGADGWYDAELGDPSLLRWTTDWFLTPDFLSLPGPAARLDAWRAMSRASAHRIRVRLEAALAERDTVYILTHVPPWAAATRAEGTLLESFWLPYNTNAALGRTIEDVMATQPPGKRVAVLAGHTHTPCHIRVSDNIECTVARASYLGRLRPEATIVI